MTYSGGQPVDRRASARRNLQVQIFLNPLNASSEISGKIQDISLSGIRIKTKIPPPSFQKGDEVRFVVNEDYLVLEGEARVIWVSPMEAVVGIKFNQLAEKTRRSLQQFLRLLT